VLRRRAVFARLREHVESLDIDSSGMNEELAMAEIIDKQNTVEQMR
jgi:hypothetical protein